MIDDIRFLITELTSFIKEIQKVTSPSIQKGKITSKCVSIVDKYFREVKPLMKEFSKNESVLKTEDNFQTLLAYTHKKSPKSKYLSCAFALKSSLIELERLALNGKANEEIDFESIDKKIIDLLNKMVPTASLSYQQAILDLEIKSRYSWRVPAVDLREALRETLDHFAPDSEVIKQPNFKLETDAKGPTMKQKMSFILKSRKINSASIQAAEKTIQTVEDTIATFVRSVYTRANVSTHTPTEKSEVARLKRYTQLALTEILALD